MVQGQTQKPMHKITIEDAKRRVRIPDLWTRYHLPGKPAKSCRCPLHDDGSNSFSVTPDGLLWNCFAGCGGGDAIDFLARLCHLDKTAACRTFLEFAGGGILAPAKFTPAKATPATPRAKPSLPPMETGTRAELDALAKLRGIGRESLEWASKRGVLRYATSQRHGERVWIVTDGEQVNAQARRMDGQGWKHLDGAKAWTLPGSWASWPLGIREAADFPAIALCEGGGDFLAAHYFALWEQASDCTKRDVQCAPTAMLGASQRIHADALPLFAGKRVRIFCHADEAGQRAARQWAEQLATVNVSADAFDFSGLVRADGKPAKDLNDCLLLNADGYGQTERILS